MDRQCFVYDLFPKPVGRYPYWDHAPLEPVVLDLCRSQVFYRNARGQASRSHSKLGRYESDLLDSNHPDLKRFYDYLVESANHFAYGVMGLQSEYPMMITSLWVNAVHRGGIEHKHLHANSIVSGTYYLNFNDQHARLRFYTPRRPANEGFSIDIETDSARNTKYSWAYTEISDIVEGDLALWPSYVEHGYVDNGADNRITISMNFMPSALCSEYSFRVARNPGSRAMPLSEPDEWTISDDVLRE
jgi:uncharacterized protein (TIGR02466 family)